MEMKCSWSYQAGGGGEKTERHLAGFSSGGVGSPGVNPVPGKAQWLTGAWGSLTAVPGDFFIVVLVISVGYDLILPILPCILLFPWSQQLQAVFPHALFSGVCVGQRNLFGGTKP